MGVQHLKSKYVDGTYYIMPLVALATLTPQTFDFGMLSLVLGRYETRFSRIQYTYDELNWPVACI
jgi:hypothetical protein